MKQELNFTPLPLLTSGKWQTILGSFGAFRTAPSSKEINILLPDGDTLVCKVSVPKNESQIKGIVLLLHGLAGSENSRYLLRISRRLIDLGYITMRINLRGCGAGQGLAKRLHYAGGSKDLITVADRIHQEFGSLPLQLVGFSLGGHILLKYLGELGDNIPPQLVQSIAVCPAVDPANTVKLFALPRNQLFEKSFVKELVDLVKVTESAYPEITKTTFPEKLSLYKFDDLYIAPKWGFKDADDYYNQCKASKFIPLIKSPCRILYSMDDPIVDPKTFDQIVHSENVRLYSTTYGGHMGFLGFHGKGWNIRWMDEQVVKWLTE
jgi:predicted alpha/beta-fold hydrolase